MPSSAESDRDRGAATTISMVLLAPVLTLVLFAAFQAALWNHARTQARVQARATAALVARSGADVRDAEAAALAALGERTDIDDASVEIDVDGELVHVRITGEAPGILMGTSTGVSVDVAMPLEGWVEL